MDGGDSRSPGRHQGGIERREGDAEQEVAFGAVLTRGHAGIGGPVLVALESVVQPERGEDHGGGPARDRLEPWIHLQQRAEAPKREIGVDALGQSRARGEVDRAARAVLQPATEHQDAHRPGDRHRTHETEEKADQQRDEHPSFRGYLVLRVGGGGLPYNARRSGASSGTNDLHGAPAIRPRAQRVRSGWPARGSLSWG
jgi:hypothetical protein